MSFCRKEFLLTFLGRRGRGCHVFSDLEETTLLKPKGAEISLFYVDLQFNVKIAQIFWLKNSPLRIDKILFIKTIKQLYWHIKIAPWLSETTTNRYFKRFGNLVSVYGCSRTLKRKLIKTLYKFQRSSYLQFKYIILYFYKIHV